MLIAYIAFGKVIFVELEDEKVRTDSQIATVVFASGEVLQPADA
jgi:hypothetical protein